MDPQPFRDLYESDSTARAFFNNFARRRRSRWETPVVRTVANLRNDGNIDISSANIISFFKRMEGLGVGTFIVGRHSHKSRFAWTVKNTDLARAAIGETSEIPDPPEAESQEPEVEEYSLEHSYNLREDFSVDFELPVDLTEGEAKRLATFIKSLPFGDE